MEEIHTHILPMDVSERFCYNPTLKWHPEVERYFVNAFGDDHLSRISRALVRPCSYSCIRVNTLKLSADAVVQKLSDMVENTSRGDAVVSTNSGMHANSIEDCLQDYTDRNFRSHGNTCTFTKSIGTGSIVKCHFSGLEDVVFVRGLGPCEIQYEYAREKHPKEVIVSRKCGEAVLKGAQVFVPGVLACSAHVEKGDVVAVSVALEHKNSDGTWSVGITRGTILRGCPTDPLHLERHGIYIGQGVSMMSRAGFFRSAHGVAIFMTDRVFDLPSLNDVLEGEIFLQNLPSIITTQVLDPRKGERILDMCAAPGGKTTAIAILMEDDGEIIAIDRSHNKVLDIRKLAAEMGLKSIVSYKLNALRAVYQKIETSNKDCFHSEDSSSNLRENMDLLQLHPFRGDDVSENHDELRTGFAFGNGWRSDAMKNIYRAKNKAGRNQWLGGRVDNSSGFSPDSFDRVLLDAPCSALGLRPRLFAGEETLESLRRHSRYQKRLFDQAVQLVRPGGVLVYSTCTINPGENESVVRYALDKYKFLSLALQHPRLGGDGLVGSCCWPDGYAEDWLKPGEERLVQRFDPSSSTDTIGFFIAKFDVGSKRSS